MSEPLLRKLQKGTVYSTDEVDTGKTWIDGKPIYRKVLKTTPSAVHTQLSVEHGISDVDTIWIDNSHSFIDIGTIFIPMNYYRTSTTYTYSHVTTDNIIYYIGATTVWLQPIYFTIEYTKTTD